MSANRQKIEVDEAIRQFAKNFFREREAAGEKPAQLAKRLGRHVGKTGGFSRATMTEIGKDRRGIGNELRRALAIELFGGSGDRLESTALSWWDENKERILGMQRGKWSTAEKVYENRGDALDRVDGIVDRTVINSLRKVRLEDKPDLPVAEWMEMALNENRLLSQGAIPRRALVPGPQAPTKKG